MDRRVELIERLKEELVVNKIRHIQLLTGVYQNKFVVKFVNVDNAHYRTKLENITNRYCESLDLANETKTTLTYFI